MDDIEKLKDENLTLRNNIDDLIAQHIALNDKLKKAEKINERLILIIENLSEGYAEGGKSK